MSPKTEFEIGKIIHFYGKLKVAVIHLTKKDLKVGDHVKYFLKDNSEFTQSVESMQIEHADIDLATKGDTFGLKIKKEPKANSKLFKVT